MSKLVIPPGLGLHPTAMALVFVSAFTAAVVGGLDSPLGAVVGGLAFAQLVTLYVTPVFSTYFDELQQRLFRRKQVRAEKGDEGAYEPALLPPV